MAQSSSSEFFSWYTVLCFILRFGPVLFSFEDADIIRTSRGGGSLKRTLPAELSNSTNHRSPHSLSMDLPLGQALPALGQCGYYRACNIALSLQLTCVSSTEPVLHIYLMTSPFSTAGTIFTHILCWPPNHHQAPANSARRKIPYLCLFKARWDSTCSLLESESLEDDLLLLSSLEVECSGFPLGSSFVRGKSDWKRLFLDSRTELTSPRGTGSPRPSLGFTYGGNLSFMRDSVLTCLLFSRKLLSLKDKGLPPNGLATLSGWGLWLLGLSYSCGASEGGMRMSDRNLLRGPVSCGFWW